RRAGHGREPRRRGRLCGLGGPPPRDGRRVGRGERLDGGRRGRARRGVLRRGRGRHGPGADRRAHAQGLVPDRQSGGRDVPLRAVRWRLAIGVILFVAALALGALGFWLRWDRPRRVRALIEEGARAAEPEQKLAAYDEALRLDPLRRDALE